MASSLYPKFKQSLLSQSPSVDLDTDTIKVTLIDTGNYTYNSAHQYMNTDTVAASAKIGSPVTLANKSVTNGVFDADNPTFSSVTGASVEAAIIWKDGGGSGTSTSGTSDILVAYIDGISVTPNGGSIILQWDDGASKIFAL